MTAALTATIMVATRAWDPLPQIAAWWSRFTAVTNPPPAWDARLGGKPDTAAVMTTGQVIVTDRGFVEAFDQDTGFSRWRHDVYWALPAADVVVQRVRPTNPDADKDHDRGYTVVHPTSGAVLWGDRDAIAVWAFADRILDLTCPDSGDCHLRARVHTGNGQTLWSVALPDGARTITGANPELVGTRDPAEWFGSAAAGSPPRLPPVIGLTIDGRVQVIDTVVGERVREVTPPDRQTRIALSGERVLFVHAEPAGDGGCRFWIAATDYRGGATVWRKDALNLDTASGVGCEQRRSPLGAGNRLIATQADGRPTLIAASDGRSVWTGAAGERILATDGELAVVQGADRKTVRVHDLLDPQSRPVWTGEFGVDPEAAVTRDHVIIRDADKDRVVVLSHFGLSTLREFKSKATIVGQGGQGLLLASGRKIGFIPLGR
jgi:hypothetical protein